MCYVYISAHVYLQMSFVAISNVAVAISMSLLSCRRHIVVMVVLSLSCDMFSLVSPSSLGTKYSSKYSTFLTLSTSIHTHTLPLEITSHEQLASQQQMLFKYQHNLVIINAMLMSQVMPVFELPIVQDEMETLFGVREMITQKTWNEKEKESNSDNNNIQQHPTGIPLDYTSRWMLEAMQQSWYVTGEGAKAQAHAYSQHDMDMDALTHRATRAQG